jgi:hypothetical protein
MAEFPNNTPPPMCGGGGKSDSSNTDHKEKRFKRNYEDNEYPSFSNPQEFLAVIQKDDPGFFKIGFEFVDFKDIASATGFEVKRQFIPLPKNFYPICFYTYKKWYGEHGIMETINGFFDERQIKYCLPPNMAQYSVQGTPHDNNLNFIINCHIEDDGKFFIEFRKTCGEGHIFMGFFEEIKIRLVQPAQLEDDDEEGGFAGGFAAGIDLGGAAAAGQNAAGQNEENDFDANVDHLINENEL